MDTTERIHLISIRENQEIEASLMLWHVVVFILFLCIIMQVLDLQQVELVYGSSFYKSIETGGNVSRALVSIHHTLLTCVYIAWL